MIARLVIAVAALSICGASLADARSRHKHHKHRHAHAMAYRAPAMGAPGQLYPSRPVWAQPWQCFTDDGYGRFRPCDAGPSLSGR